MNEIILQIEQYGLIIEVINKDGYKAVCISGQYPYEKNVYCQPIKTIPDNEWKEDVFRMWANGLFNIIRRADFDR